MEDSNKYIEVNRKLWDDKIEFHINSDFYDVQSFLKGRNSLTEIERALLKDIDGKTVLHLQCHFGQDTISLGYLGALPTGIDFSPKAIETAIHLAKQTSSPAQFICSDVYDLPNQLSGQFDIVFTSFGVIGWLPDLNRWASVIAHFLKSGGKFVFAEFHPVVWMFDDNFTKVQYSYFNEEEIIELTSGTYADRNAPIQNESISWNHSLGEVLSSLINQGLDITSFEEFDYSPYNCFADMIQVEERRYSIQSMGNKIPLVYALTATKK